MLLNIFNKKIKKIAIVGPEIIFNEEIEAPLFLEKYSHVNKAEKT